MFFPLDSPDTPLPDWFDQVPLASYLIPFGGLAAIIMLIVLWFRVAHPFAMKVSHFIDDFFGEKERPGVERKPGVLERLENVQNGVDDVKKSLETSKETLEAHSTELVTLKGELATLKHEVTPNHGSSAHDSLMAEIKRGNKMVESLSALVNRMEEDLKDSKADRKKIWERIENDGK